MSYLGSKGASGCYQQIIANMPPHDTYIESHLGSGVVLKKKPLASKSYGLDLDNTVLQFQHDDSVKLINTDAIKFLSKFDYKSHGRVFIYADPPYLLTTRTSNKRYKYEYSEQDHIDLISTLKKIPAQVMLSGYPSGLYDELLSDWRTFEFQSMTRGGVRTEKLWMNYSEERAYSHTFAGTNFTDRQRIKRKAERWANKFKELSPAEQLAILSALTAIKKD